MTPDTTYSGELVHVDNMPVVTPDMDLLSAALAYAGVGLYIAPTSARGESPGKNPGTLLGSSWPTRTVTGAADAYALFGEQFATEAVGIALHCGRSGLVVVDIDTEDVNLIPREIVRAVTENSPPYQTTRKGGRARGHYFFRQPPGRRISNGMGRLPKGWGDIRGTNGVVILAGSWHPKQEGEYRQQHAGPIPVLPDYVADLLPDGTDTHAAVADSEVAAFIANTAHHEMAPNAAKGPVKRFAAEIAKGGSRHNEAAAAAVWICREARAGGYPAGPALDALWRQFHAAVTADPGSFSGRLHEGGPEREFRGILAWAVAQALGETEDRLREARERMANPPRSAQPPPATVINAPDFTQPSAQPQSPPLIEGLMETLSAESLTDAVVAQRVHDELLHDRFVWSVGFGWLKWSGKFWQEVPEETLVEEIRVWAIEKIKPELFDPTIAKDVKTRLLGLLDKYRLVALATLARGICQVAPDTFDRDADLLNTQSGIVDLRTGELIPHDASYHMTRITEAAYVAGATHPDWTTALEATAPDVADWLQGRLGQAITGYMTPDDLLVIFRGGGSNGKSTLLDAVKGALGRYGSYISDRVLLAEAGAHPTELTEFRGARFALTEELPDEGRLNAKRLKDIIGTPTMTARKIRQDSITWRSTHSMFLSTNPLPKVTETDNGTWRRLALVEFPWTYVGPEVEQLEAHQRRGDGELRDRVATGRAQQEAVLAWLVAGAMRFYANDKRMPAQPESVLNSTRQWREQSDLILRFWSECLTPDENFFITSRDMLDVFNEWLGIQGHRPRSAQAFMAQFGEHEVTKKHRVFYSRAKVKVADVASAKPAAPGLVWASSLASNSTLKSGDVVRAWWGVRFVPTA